MKGDSRTVATKTPRFQFWKPTLDGDENLWGEYLNENWQRIDEILLEETLPDSHTYGRANDGLNQYWVRVYSKTEIDEIFAAIDANISATYLFDTDITETQPTNGYLKYDNLHASLVDAIYISSTTQPGNDAEEAIASLVPNTLIKILDRDLLITYEYEVTTAPVNNGGWWTLPVVYTTAPTTAPPLQDAFLNITAGSQAFNEPPDDGQTYGRMYEVWLPVYTKEEADARFMPIDAPTFPEPPDDGITYGRKFEEWLAVYTQEQADGTFLPIGTPIIQEPPDDGITYGRLFEQWQAV
jgi:hypothetical protein